MSIIVWDKPITYIPLYKQGSGAPFVQNGQQQAGLVFLPHNQLCTCVCMHIDTGSVRNCLDPSNPRANRANPRLWRVEWFSLSSKIFLRPGALDFLRECVLQLKEAGGAFNLALTACLLKLLQQWVALLPCAFLGKTQSSKFCRRPCWLSVHCSFAVKVASPWTWQGDTRGTRDDYGVALCKINMFG